MMQRRWGLRFGQPALAAAALVLSASANAAPPSAAMLANACAGCHGTLGGSAGPAMPSLAGQSKDAIVVAMQKFKSGERPSTIMGRLAKGYTDADFAAMGDFFGSQKIHPTQQNLDAKLVAKGAQMHESNCGRCHIEEGREGKDDSPAMASQWLPYLQMQMAMYVNGSRKMPLKMAEKVQPLSQQDLEALLQFYASVK